MRFNKYSLLYLIVEPSEDSKAKVVMRSARENTEPAFELELSLDEVVRLQAALTMAKEHLETGAISTSIQARFGSWLGSTGEKKP